MAEHIITANAKYARDLGFDYGFSTDEAQAQLLTGFMQGVTAACGPLGPGVQLAYMLDKLDRKTLTFLADLGNSAQLHLDTKEPA